MSRDERSHSEPTHDDPPIAEAWLSRVRDAYAPAPMTLHQRLAFDARLEERITRARRRNLVFGIAGPALVAAAVILLWITVTPREDAPRPTTQIAAETPPARPASLRAWQHEVIAAADPPASSPADPETGDLPAEYQALESLFLAGANGGQHVR